VVFSLSEGNKTLQIFENKVATKIFERKRNEVNGQIRQINFVPHVQEERTGAL
jgi:hypothetical protein